MRTEVWQHFDQAFKKADEAFAKADKAFNAAGRSLFKEDYAEHMNTPSGSHKLRFTARTAAERWRLFKKFFKMAVAVAIHGKTTLNFQSDK